MAADTTLPTVDLAALDAGDPAELRALRTATHGIGFFYLAGHGDEAAADAADELIAAAREFFALPERRKRAIENVRSPHFRGYTMLGGERTQGRVDWREQLDIGAERAAAPPDPQRPWRVLEGPNQWPEEVPRLRGAALDWMDRSSAVGRRLLRAWAVSLGAPAGHFDAAFAEPDPLLKIVRYPGHDGSVSGQGVGGHKDVGALTLLYPEPGTSGLQVEAGGHWIDVAPRRGSFIVNIGELLEVATDGYLKATNHKVLPPPEGSDRISLPFFLNPGFDQALPPVDLDPALAAGARGVGRDSHGGRMHAVYGLNALKSRLRAHPDVARRHHRDLLEMPGLH